MSIQNKPSNVSTVKTFKLNEAEVSEVSTEQEKEVAKTLNKVKDALISALHELQVYLPEGDSSELSDNEITYLLNSLSRSNVSSAELDQAMDYLNQDGRLDELNDSLQQAQMLSNRLESSLNEVLNGSNDVDMAPEDMQTLLRTSNQAFAAVNNSYTVIFELLSTTQINAQAGAAILVASLVSMQTSAEVISSLNTISQLQDSIVATIQSLVSFVATFNGIIDTVFNQMVSFASQSGVSLTNMTFVSSSPENQWNNNPSWGASGNPTGFDYILGPELSGSTSAQNQTPWISAGLGSTTGSYFLANSTSICPPMIVNGNAVYSNPLAMLSGGTSGALGVPYEMGDGGAHSAINLSGGTTACSGSEVYFAICSSSNTNIPTDSNGSSPIVIPSNLFNLISSSCQTTNMVSCDVSGNDPTSASMNIKATSQSIAYLNLQGMYDLAANVMASASAFIPTTGYDALFGNVFSNSDNTNASYSSMSNSMSAISQIATSASSAPNSSLQDAQQILSGVGNMMQTVLNSILPDFRFQFNS